MRSLLRSVVLALSIAGAAGAAQAADAVAPRLLSVNGEGTVRARPDMATINAGVVTQAKTAGEALPANTEAMNRVLDALREAGIASRDLQTSGFNVEAVYSQPPRDYDGTQPFQPTILGYMVRNELTIRVRDLAKTGEILDHVIKLGANSVSGPTFGVADPTPLEDEARKAAMRDAIRKAKLYSEAGSVTLGPVERIDESVRQFAQPVPQAMIAREAASDAKVPVESGELSFVAQVSVSWRLAD